jgi:hypothetical protein
MMLTELYYYSGDQQAAKAALTDFFQLFSSLDEACAPRCLSVGGTSVSYLSFAKNRLRSEASRVQTKAAGRAG